MTSKTSIETDAPVTLNYGSLTNDLFLLDYGFVISSNPHDHVELKYDGVLLDAAAIATGASSPSFSSPTEWQREILSQLNLHGDGAFLKVAIPTPPTRLYAFIPCQESPNSKGKEGGAGKFLFLSI